MTSPEARCLCGQPVADHQPLKQAWYIVKARISHWIWAHA